MLTLLTVNAAIYVCVEGWRVGCVRGGVGVAEGACVRACVRACVCVCVCVCV